MIRTQVAGGTQYEYLAGKITSTGPGFADFARVQLTSGGVILADDATGADGDALGRAVAVGGSSNDVAAVAGTGGAHVYRGDATYTSWTWVHARTTAGPAAVAVAGDLVFVSEDGGPAVALAVVGLFPVNRGGRCVLGLAATCDGVHFGALEELLDLGCEIQGRTADYPVDGFLVDGDALVVFVHRDMPTEDIVKAGAERLAPRLVRHDVALDAVRALTRRAKADLATCATGAEFAPLPADAPTTRRYPLCDDDAVSVPFSKLNTPAAFAEKQRAAAEARAAAAEGGR